MIDLIERGKAFEKEEKREIRDLSTGGLRTQYDVDNFKYHRLMFAIHWGIL